MPQTPPAASDWITWFPDEDERDSWTHRLANLVPLHVRKNPAASNYDFATKKNVYFKGKGTASPFILTQEVRSENTWTPAMLDDRQKRLVGVFKKHWSLDVPPTESVSKALDTTAAGLSQTWVCQRPMSVTFAMVYVWGAITRTCLSL